MFSTCYGDRRTKRGRSKRTSKYPSNEEKKTWLKKYCLVHFTRNKKETTKDLVNFCFALEEKAKSKLKNCRIRKKEDLLGKWVNMLKEGELRFVDFRSRDWFLELIKGGHK